MWFWHAEYSVDTVAQNRGDAASAMDTSPQPVPSLQPRSASAENNGRRGHWATGLPQRDDGTLLEKDWGL